MLFHEPVNLVQLFDKLGSSACCHWTAENVDQYLGIWRQNEFRFFAGRTYTHYRNAFHKQSPFRCTLDCREQQSGQLAVTLTANFTAKLTLKISQNWHKKSREISQFYCEINPKNPTKFVFFSAKYQKACLFLLFGLEK